MKLGDLIERITYYTGIKWLWKKLYPDCKCKERQEQLNDIVEQELQKLHWYDKKVYNLIQDEYSITELSKKTNITYHSLYNTYRKVKDRLKEKLKE